MLSTAAFGLRQFSIDRKRIPKSLDLRPGSAPALRFPEPAPLGKIDLIGGNGRFRQKLAEKEWEMKKIEDIERRKQQKILDEERRRKQAEREARRRRIQEESERQRKEERERELIEKEEKERRRIELEEKERLDREEKERQWLARQPKICETCGGTGKCFACNGEGAIFSTFLVTNVTGEAVHGGGYGKVVQGCEECRGLKQGIRGELTKGTGSCERCGGWGKIKPNVTTRQRTFTNIKTGLTSDDFSPTSSAVASPKFPPRVGAS